MRAGRATRGETAERIVRGALGSSGWSPGARRAGRLPRRILLANLCASPACRAVIHTPVFQSSIVLDQRMLLALVQLCRVPHPFGLAVVHGAKAKT
jgi:hypothetical protein